jgi:hypothetical protein
MDDPPSIPLEFANQVIKRMVTNQAGPSLTRDDCMALRVVFRNLGGTWEAVYHGEMVPTRLLSKIVTNWVKMQANRPKPVPTV